ncbi:hypothetical protein FHP29_19970 [Nocardioides albidus]|uniref:Uncharacterized protein n=1 Tax=Nocardioides albidus TaxID=1517589 RepID=A0A5C4VKR0_9ACTN|nr:hypothetical protein [Nocardioides albidus]TNM36420.1 hypothetical protein FHP29_19970 [Nocardioides albidus]
MADRDTPDDTDPTGRARPDDRRLEHDEFRSLLTPSKEVPRIGPIDEPITVAGHDVPRFEPLEGAGELPGFDPDAVRRRRSDRRRSHHRHRPRPRAEAAPVEPAKEPAKQPVKERVASGPSADGRRETLIVVAVLVVLIVLGAIYVAAQRSDQPRDSGLPQSSAQGASRVSSQPLAVRA